MSDEKNLKTLEFKEAFTLFKIRLLSTIFFKSVSFFHPNSHHHLPENSSKVSTRSLWNFRRGRKEAVTLAQTHAPPRGSRRACAPGLRRFRSSLAPAEPWSALAQRTRPRGLSGHRQDPSCLRPRESNGRFTVAIAGKSHLCLGFVLKLPIRLHKARVDFYSWILAQLLRLNLLASKILGSSIACLPPCSYSNRLCTLN